MATKANHHYIPQFYLRSFSEGVGRQARVFVFDSETKKPFVTHVRNVGSERHFNKVEFVGVDNNAIEDGMAEIETLFALNLSEVVKARSFPSDESFNYLMNLIAYLSVRNPRFRQQLEKFRRDSAQAILDLSISKESIWASQIKGMKEAGYPVDDDVTYAEAKEFHDSGDYDIEVDQTALIQMEFKMIDPVLKCLARRNWCFASAPKGSQYITSDDPVALFWTNEVKSGFFGPGHGLPETSLVFPLCPDLTLIGRFEPLPKEIFQTPLQVATTNTNIARFSTKQIYAKDSNFRVNLRDKDNVSGDQLSKAFRDMTSFESDG